MPSTPARSRISTVARGTALVVAIMFLGSLVLWIGTPLLWLWVGSQVQGATDSVGAGFAVALLGAIVTVALEVAVLARLSNTYRAYRVSRGLTDPGHAVLERVLIVSAGISVLAFAIWFMFLAGATPLPLSIPI